MRLASPGLHNALKIHIIRAENAKKAVDGRRRATIGGKGMPQEKQSKPAQAAQKQGGDTQVVYTPAQEAAEYGLPLIVFDLDGTLADSYRLAVESLRRVFERLGFGDLPLGLLESLSGSTCDEVCRAMGIGPDRRAVYDRLLAEAEQEMAGRYAKLFYGAMDTLHALVAEASLCLLTNRTDSYMERTLGQFGISDLFVRRSAHVPGMSKADWIRRWRQELRAQRAMMVGDRRADIEQAHAAGALALGVTYGMGGIEELMEADALAGDLGEVLLLCRRFIEKGVLGCTGDQS